MHFHISTSAIKSPALLIRPHPLQTVESIKLYGIILDSNLGWGNHVYTIITAAKYQLHTLRRMKALGGSQRVLKDLYTNFYPPQTPPCFIHQKKLHQLEKVRKGTFEMILTNN